MNIKNYTSSISVFNSISKIEQRLAQTGALHISKSYEKDRPVGMMFQIMVNNFPMIFKLPAKADKVYNHFIKQRKYKITESQKQNLRTQADRTAWKILSDWVDIQISLIQLDQAEPIEVFLPYSFNPEKQQTLYEVMRDNNFKQLTQ